jgi:hypothetical protein
MLGWESKIMTGQKVGFLFIAVAFIFAVTSVSLVSTHAQAETSYSMYSCKNGTNDCKAIANKNGYATFGSCWNEAVRMIQNKEVASDKYLV